MRKLLISLLIIICISCSSAPKKPTEIVTVRRIAEQELNLGNKAGEQGQYENAILLLTEARRKAISVDDPSLIIRASLALGNVLLSLERKEEAFKEWDKAILEAQRTGDTELLSVARVFRAKGLLLSGDDTPQNVLNIVSREQANIKNNRFYIAFAWQVRGLALRAQGSYTEAENAIKRSLEINEKDRYLEYASYDWYIIASIRSLAGNYTGAIQALEASMAIDRRIENTRGLAASWKAMGDVYNKMGRVEDAKAAHERAEMILRALN